MVVEAWIAVLLHPVEAVVVAVVMVHGAIGCVTKPQIDAGDAGEVLEGGEVGSRAYGADRSIPEIADCLAWDGLIRGGDKGGCFIDGFAQERRGVDVELRPSCPNVDV